MVNILYKGMCDELKKICENYLIGVFNELYDSSNIDDDWWHDTFLFESTNNYIQGKYDIMKSDIDTKYINSYLKDNFYNIIKYINSFYEDNYGKECILDWKKFDDKYLVRNFLYVYGHDNINELKEKLV